MIQDRGAARAQRHSAAATLTDHATASARSRADRRSSCALSSTPMSNVLIGAATAPDVSNGLSVSRREALSHSSPSSIVSGRGTTAARSPSRPRSAVVGLCRVRWR
eukprot:5192324-Prymnesium_polylepis.1